MIKVCVFACRPVRLSHVNTYGSFGAQQAVNGLLNLLWKTEKGSYHTHNIRDAVLPAETKLRIRDYTYGYDKCKHGDHMSILPPLITKGGSDGVFEAFSSLIYHTTMGFVCKYLK